ncbi:hypothetical protein GTY62_15230 [Streptomyces sp. SID724]|uniref:hypothetical protein n=1 Tax=Streptomyces sp. SID724 TaxID=2690324 RepID=UPI0013610A77|nr:hypothetical protein [Streptomyces sp. SID724]
MPVLNMTPGQSPEAPGSLAFFKQGSAPSSGFVVTSEGVVTGVLAAEDLAVTDDLTVGDQLSVAGFTSLASAQTSGDFTSYGGGGIVIGTAGAGISIKEGANARAGSATLVAGTVVVPTNKVTANSRIYLTPQTSGAGPGALRISARTPGTNFTITSTSATDTSLVAWEIREPAA